MIFQLLHLLHHHQHHLSSFSTSPFIPCEADQCKMCSYVLFPIFCSWLASRMLQCNELRTVQGFVTQSYPLDGVFLSITEKHIANIHNSKVNNKGFVTRGAAY